MRYSEYRQEKILDVLRRGDRASVNVLASQLGVSPESIRRDLRELELRGVARRVYGGAVVSPAEGDRSFVERARLNAREKGKIGEATATLVKDGMKVFVSSGTTTLACVKHLSTRKGLTIVTNSIAVAVHFFSRDWGTSVTVLGGTMAAEHQATYGHATVTALKAHFFDLAILGTSAVHIEQGYMEYGEDAAALHNAARAQATRAVIVADSSKFGCFGSVRTCAVTDIDTVVTGGKIPDEFLERYSQANVKLIQA